MRLKDIQPLSFKSIAQEIDLEATIDFLLPSMRMVEACRSDDFDFFQPLISQGRLTVEQMRHAAKRYFLGKTKSGQPIFWMIDDMLQPLDAYIGEGTWISDILKRRKPDPLKYWTVQNCLFGLHLLSVASVSSAVENTPVSIVEREQSAVVLSELYPQNLWMATACLRSFSYDQLKPLTGRQVKIFPHTDETMSNYVCWLEIADTARRTYHLDISCSAYLEDHATPSQKERGIDLLDFILES